MVSQEIKTFIKDHGLQENDKLPSVAILAEMLGVGRSSIREGLRDLEATGFIRVENGKGIFVRDADIYRIEATIKVENEKIFLLQISEVRRALEGKAVELAAKNATDEQIVEMEKLMVDYERLREKGEETAEVDLKFHKAIYKASQNPVLSSVVESVWDTFNRFWMKPFGIDTIFDDSFPFHKTMLEAIKKHDVKQAKKEFNKLLDTVENSIRQVNI